MEFKDIVMERYAAKRFDGRIIDDPTLFKLLDIIRYSPSAFNLQPWKIKVITASRIKINLLPHTNNQLQVTTCSHLFVFCANTELEKLADKAVDSLARSGLPPDTVSQYMTMIREYIGSMSEEQRNTFAREQIHIALGNAVNGAKSLGLDSCPMGGFDPVAYADILFLPEGFIPVVLCAMGYAADKPHPKWRLPREEVFF